MSAATVIVNAAAPNVAAVGGTFQYNGNQEAASATALGIDGSAPVTGNFAFTYTGAGTTTYGSSPTPPTNVGTYGVVVQFTSTNPNYTNGSAITTIVITPATASVVVVSSENPSTFGDSVSFTATVSSAAGTPTGTVQFVVDGTNFGSLVSLSGATATSPTTTTLTPGEHVVAAAYSGDNNFQSSTSPFLIQVVNNPLVSIAVTPVNPSIFVGGTEQFAATGTFTDNSSAILPTGGTWALGNTMTNGVRAPMAVAGGTGLLYYFGGQDAGGAEQNYVQTYNPATGAWNTVTPTPAMTARYQGVAVAPGNGLIYVIGGWNNSTPTSVVEAYDPVGNTWTPEASLGHLSGCSVAGAINGLIYVLTGCDGNSGFSNEFDVYNPATNTWTSLSSPATRTIPARVGLSAANSTWRVGTTLLDGHGNHRSLRSPNQHLDHGKSHDRAARRAGRRHLWLAICTWWADSITPAPLKLTSMSTPLRAIRGARSPLPSPRDAAISAWWHSTGCCMPQAATRPLPRTRSKYSTR